MDIGPNVVSFGLIVTHSCARECDLPASKVVSCRRHALEAWSNLNRMPWQENSTLQRRVVCVLAQ